MSPRQRSGRSSARPPPRGGSHENARSIEFFTNGYAPAAIGLVDEFFTVQFKSDYTIGFALSLGNGGVRSIRVISDAGDGRELIVRTRAGYYAHP
jgi:hypothetical protein